MPFEPFDRRKLILKPLCERESDLDLSSMLEIEGKIPDFKHKALPILADKISGALKSGASVIMMTGGHVIRSGVSKFLIELMKKKIITHFAMNGSCIIHDFELALIGETTESVEKYISEGQFGLWKETGKLNEAIKNGAKENIGLGEAVGKMIEEDDLPNKEISLLAAGYRYKIPVTVHIGIGSDIIHEHPNFDAAAAGETSYKDFLIFANAISNLENGVFMNFGSAVTGPEVYLKALSMARNLAKQQNNKITNFTTAVFDLLPLENKDTTKAPEKSDYFYYFRPWKTILSRTVADGGKSFYICGKHRATISNLARILLDMQKGDR
jgi:hypothetical protein